MRLVYTIGIIRAGSDRKYPHDAVVLRRAQVYGHAVRVLSVLTHVAILRQRSVVSFQGPGFFLYIRE